MLSSSQWRGGRLGWSEKCRATAISKWLQLPIPSFFLILGPSAVSAHFATFWDYVQVIYILCILPVSYEESERDYLSLIARFDPCQ